MRFVTGVVLMMVLLGCRTEPAAVGDANFPTRQTYNVPPKQLLERVKSVIRLPIESENEGRIITGWESHTGAKFGVAGAGRTWQERTRYTISIAPAWDDPSSKSTIEVTEETQQRPHDKYEWGSQDPVKRPERAAQMAQKIDTALSSSAK